MIMNVKNMSVRTKRIILIAILLIVFAFFAKAIYSRVNTIQNQKQIISSLEETKSEVEEENSKVQQTLDSGVDESYIEKVAREEYNYVNPEERVYYDSDNS